MSKQMLILQLCCPHCKATLTEGNRVHLDAHVPSTHQDGEIFLSAVFGEYNIETTLTIPEGETVEFRCPSCDESIMLDFACKTCGAKMASLNQVEGSHVEFCSRRGCKGHTIGGHDDIDESMSLMNKKFNTPYD